MKKILIAITMITAVWSIEPELAIKPEEKTSFTYVCMGVTGSALVPNKVAGIDPFVGRRQFFAPHHAIDLGVGTWFPAFGMPAYIGTSKENLFYGQGSYLYYFFGSKGPYLGGGVTVGTTNRTARVTWVNCPITFGYHYRLKNNFSSFVQCQVSPITTPMLGMATISYGFGF